MKKRIILMILLASMTTIAGCGSDTERIENKVDRVLEALDSQSQDTELRKQLEAANNELTALKQQQKNNSSSSSSFINIKFWQDGKTYREYDEEFNFYSDCFCSQELNTDVKIISPIVDEVELSNDMTVYATLSDSGIIYSTEYPDLEEITE